VRWRNTYLGLLVVAIIVEMLAFVVPMVAFHRAMVRQRNKLRDEADRRSEELQQLESRMAVTDDDNERARIAERAKLLRDRYLTVKSMPTWPVDPRTRRRISVNNGLLLLPLVAKAVGVTNPRGDAIEKIREILG